MPDDIEALKAALVGRARAPDHGGWPPNAAAAKAKTSDVEALIARLELRIEKLERELYGPAPNAGAADRAAGVGARGPGGDRERGRARRWKAAAQSQTPRSRPSRASGRPASHFPHLPRERVVIAGADDLPLLRRPRLAKLGEDVTETLEVIPRQWKVIQTVRERLSAGTAKRSASRRRRSTSYRAAGRGPACSRRSCSRSSASIGR